MKRIVRPWVLKRMEIIAARGDSTSLDCRLWNIKDIPANWNIMTLSSWCLSSTGTSLVPVSAP